MARKKQKGNGAGTVYPRKDKEGKVIGYRGSYFDPSGKRPRSSMSPTIVTRQIIICLCKPIVESRRADSNR